jgi:hypothetical protein
MSGHGVGVTDGRAVSVSFTVGLDVGIEGALCEGVGAGATVVALGVEIAMGASAISLLCGGIATANTPMTIDMKKASNKNPIPAKAKIIRRRVSSLILRRRLSCTSRNSYRCSGHSL